MGWAFLFPLGVSQSLLALAVVSLLFHFAFIFTSVTPIILLHGWNQMTESRRQVPITSNNRRMFLNYGIIPHVSLFSDRFPYFSDQQVLNSRDRKKWTPFCPKRPLLSDFPDKQGWANARNSYAWSAFPNSYIQHKLRYFQHSRRLPGHLIFISTWKRKGRGIALPILDPGARRLWVVNATLQQLFSRERGRKLLADLKESRKTRPNNGSSPGPSSP
jgi:hypothetical protein